MPHQTLRTSLYLTDRQAAVLKHLLSVALEHPEHFGATEQVRWHERAEFTSVVGQIKARLEG
jgi:hypothetical protein